MVSIGRLSAAGNRSPTVIANASRLLRNRHVRGSAATTYIWFSMMGSKRDRRRRPRVVFRDRGIRLGRDLMPDDIRMRESSMVPFTHRRTEELRRNESRPTYPRRKARRRHSQREDEVRSDADRHTTGHLVVSKGDDRTLMAIMALPMATPQGMKLLAMAVSTSHGDALPRSPSGRCHRALMRRPRANPFGRPHGQPAEDRRVPAPPWSGWCRWDTR